LIFFIIERKTEIVSPKQSKLKDIKTNVKILITQIRGTFLFYCRIKDKNFSYQNY